MKPRHLQNLLLTLCMALSCVSGAAAVIHVSGYEGRDVQVSCSYEHGYESYEKYLCRNDCGSDDVLVTTTQGNNTKYSITDDHNKPVYTTTISVLTSGDAGKYWCGVTRTGKDYYPAEVQLKVVPDSCCDLSTTIHGHEGGSVSISCLYNSVDQNNLKYFCRGQKPSTCLEQAVVTSDEKHQGRYTLTNGSLQFTMTIDRLTLQDPGWYLCGIQRNTGLDVFSAVQLEVKGAAVIVSQSTIKGADVLSEENMYGNQEMVTCSKPGISKQQEDYDDAGDQQDCVYENFNTTDDIYCNEFYSKGNQR
ncbi:hypothetical protein INR49_026445 [Caranx melampygus]|nr:hypothetical protein INR49_026445 [Caranx melampygus]